MIGATVEIAGRDGTWVIAQTYPRATPPSWRCLKAEGEKLVGIDVVATQMTLISPPPTFTPGTIVQLFEEEGTVVEDRGDTVLVALTHDQPAGSGLPKRVAGNSVNKRRSSSSSNSP